MVTIVFNILTTVFDDIKGALFFFTKNIFQNSPAFYMPCVGLNFAIVGRN